MGESVAAASRSAIYDYLMRHAAGDSNDAWLAQMLSNWLAGHSALPDHFGLGDDGMRALLDDHFPGVRLGMRRGVMPSPDRQEEIDDLAALMLGERAGREDSETRMASIVAFACMGMDHLWHDLGLWSRDELSALMRSNFPGLAARNTRDMKWKKFLYKQLCEGEGIYVCRAPSCDVCADYELCYGPEVG